MKAAPITLGEVMLYLASESERRAIVARAFGRLPDSREIRMLLLASNVVDVLRQRPKLWAGVKKVMLADVSMRNSDMGADAATQ